MALIHVPRPENAWNPDRAANALLRKQVEHVHEAERRLPVRYRSDIYINAIKTEGEAAKYIRAVTEAIHDAHLDAAYARRAPKRAHGLDLGAAADSGSERKKGASQKKKGIRKKKKR